MKRNLIKRTRAKVRAIYNGDMVGFKRYPSKRSSTPTQRKEFATQVKATRGLVRSHFPTYRGLGGKRSK